MPQTCLLRAQCDDPIRRFLFPKDFIGNGMIFEHATPASHVSAGSTESDLSLSRMSSQRSFINGVPSDQCTGSRPLVRLDPISRKEKKVVRFEYLMEKVLFLSPESKVSPLPEGISNLLEDDKHGSFRRCTLRAGISSGIQPSATSIFPSSSTRDVTPHYFASHYKSPAAYVS
ncbi:hypothetical protein BDV37DRAFT_65509 [Aspergillus pseudonomiae]|uniref:Uncharacterized protein n=1 Tax=Aspergillus pseudonomiae TaxID=1506151 RepID=A0A5N7CSH2_9EURO|nr:uncharacterized protein BDV37DRAFT_65509 [Aspergillus pseudonomiae]KAE8397190.1 hypothetical protein BDV37DRAFT_65509 [Aspergillus pseudonomiae]